MTDKPRTTQQNPLGIDPDEVFHKLLNAGNEWVAFNAKAKLLEDCEKSELSQIVQEKLKQGASSNAGAENEARADSRYREYIERKTEARKQADEARVKYEAAKTWWEAKRTVAATLRQEMRMTS